jgi:Caenorhabditis protein of unknown function, DUF268
MKSRREAISSIQSLVETRRNDFMKRWLRNIYRLFVLFGIDPIKTLNSLRGMPAFLYDLQRLKRQKIHAPEDFPFGRCYPCLGDKYSGSGSASGHYFHQDLLVARRIYLNNPKSHVDVGSRVDGFVAHVASFRPIEVLDIRPLNSTIRNIKFVRADLMGPLDEKLLDYCDSLSCLHALEHFGLGRYGDPVNYDGYLLGLDNLRMILKKDGKLYLSVPIGPQRIEFNAHRVFSVGYMLACFSGKYHIDQFSIVDDHGNLHEDVPIVQSDVQNDYGCQYGCGIFEMTKI